MAARTPSIHVYLGRPLFLLSPGIHSIINFASLSSCILLTWPYHWSLFPLYGVYNVRLLFHSHYFLYIYIYNAENIVQEDEAVPPFPDGRLRPPSQVGVCKYFELVLVVRQSYFGQFPMQNHKGVMC